MAHASTLRTVTANELAHFYGSATDLYDLGRFVCYDNPAYRAIEWSSFHDDGYVNLTRAQQVVTTLQLATAQINNGGIAQLFLNYHDEIDVVSAAIEEFGWRELTQKFHDVFRTSFTRPSILGKIGDIHAAASRGKAHFNDVLAFVDGEAFDDCFYEEPTQAALQAATLGYIMANEAGLFDVVDRNSCRPRS